MVKRISHLACGLLNEYLVVDIERAWVKMCCKLPFVKLEAQERSNTAFYETLHHGHFQYIRRQARETGATKGCGACYTAEKEGLPSFRDKHRRDIQILHQTPRVKTLELQLGNVCNMKCHYCSPAFSTLWQTEEPAENALPTTELATFQKGFWSWLHVEGWQTLEQINLVGGEPFLSPRFTETLEQLVSAFAQAPVKPRLIIVTNGNAPEVLWQRGLQKIRKLLRDWPVVIGMSGESQGTAAEYVRRGLNWTRFAERFAKLLADSSAEHWPQISVFSSQNALCVGGHLDFLRWAESLALSHKVQLHYQCNIVTWPLHLSPLALPVELAVHYRGLSAFAQQSAGFINAPEMVRFFRQIAESMEKPRSPELFARMLINLRSWDRKHGSNFRQSLPFLSELEAAWLKPVPIRGDLGEKRNDPIECAQN